MRALDRSLVLDGDRNSRARLDQLTALAVAGRLPPTLGTTAHVVEQVVASPATVLAASANLADQPPISTWRPDGSAAEMISVRGPGEDGEPEEYRIWARQVPMPTEPLVIYVGNSLESVAEATATLRDVLVVGVPITLGAMTLLLWYSVGRALRPIEAIRAEVAEITEGGLRRRVRVPAADDEVSRLAGTMNRMLDRLDVGRQREHDFLADASHELLSPLAASRAILESGGPPSGASTDLRRQLLAENASMERIVRDLLFLARDQPPATAFTAVDLDDIVLEEATRIRSTTTSRIDTSSVSAGPVHGDPDQLRRLVRNLLENAARHATTEVRVTLTGTDDDVSLEVVDDGPGVPPDLTERIFDRFYRADPSRSRVGGGTGLGLAICRDIARNHGGRLWLAENSGGARFVVRLPQG